MKSNIHSDILVHWTLKELRRQSVTEGDSDFYLKRLQSLYTNGIMFNAPDNPDIVRSGTADTELPCLPVICFTELKLSEVKQHTEEYGDLGIGFRRDFLMRRGANPVFYMQSMRQGIVNNNLKILAELRNETNGLNVFLSYVKPMNKLDDDKLTYYDEMEWRIVFAKYEGEQIERFEERDDKKWFKFHPNEVALLVFPNEVIRKRALKDPKLQEAFKVHTPMMVDVDHCNSF